MVQNGVQQYQNNTVSDIIHYDDVSAWKKEEVIVIKAGTGKGKSYFIKNTLYQFAKDRNQRILYLVHRSAIAEQFMLEIDRDNKNDIIDIRTYQSVESRIRYDGKNPVKLIRDNIFEDYDYIVCDEFHYFCGDSGFNSYTDSSFINIFRYQRAIKICMSATPDEVNSVLKKFAKQIDLKIKQYDIESDYSNIERLFFYDNKEKPEEILSNIIPGEKAIVFGEVNEMYRLHTLFPDSLFLCSKSNNVKDKGNLYQYVDEAAIKQMLINERFETQFLFTTTCFDAGANLRDRSITTIIVDVGDIGSLIQCVGRKRIIDKKDTYDLYIRRHTNGEINGWRTKVKKKIEMAQLLLTDHTEYVKQYGREPNLMAYTKLNKGELVVRLNRLRYYKALYDYELYTTMMEEYGEFGYCKYLAKYFGKYGYNKERKDYDYYYRIYNDSIERLDEKLCCMCGYNESYTPIIMYTNQDRENLIKAVNCRNSKGKLIKNLKAINDRLKELQLSYEIEKTCVYDDDGNRCRSAWIVKDTSNYTE